MSRCFGSGGGLNKPDMIRPRRPPRGILHARIRARGARLRPFLAGDDLAPFVEHFWTVKLGLWQGRRPTRFCRTPRSHLVLQRGASRIVGMPRGGSPPGSRGRSGSWTKFRPGGFPPLLAAAGLHPYRPEPQAYARSSAGRPKGLEERALAHEDPVGAFAEVQSFLRSSCRCGTPRRSSPPGSPSGSPEIARLARVDQVGERLRPGRALAPAPVRGVRRRQPQVGPAALPPARGGRADRRGGGARLAGPGARARLCRPGALHPRLPAAGGRSPADYARGISLRRAREPGRRGRGERSGCPVPLESRVRSSRSPSPCPRPNGSCSSRQSRARSAGGVGLPALFGLPFLVAGLPGSRFRRRLAAGPPGPRGPAPALDSYDLGRGLRRHRLLPDPQTISGQAQRRTPPPRLRAVPRQPWLADHPWDPAGESYRIGSTPCAGSWPCSSARPS